jgi:hypothetical protein
VFLVDADGHESCATGISGCNQFVNYNQCEAVDTDYRYDHNCFWRIKNNEKTMIKVRNV